MAEVTLAYRIFFALSRVPGLYRIILWCKRIGLSQLKRFVAEIFRRIAPASWPRVGAPKKAVSFYDALLKKDPSVQGRVVLERQELTPMPPESVCERLRVTQGLQTEIYQPWPIVWTRHQNARLVSDSLGLVIPPKSLAIESTYGPTGLWNEPAFQYCVLPAAVKLHGNYTSIVSRWARTHQLVNFSHWLFDVLPRLAILDECPKDTVVIVPAKLHEYQKESLRMIGLEGRFRCTAETHLLVENYYLSSPASMIMCESGYSLKFLRDRFLPKASPNFRGPKRFVIDRKGVTRGVQNREEFNQFFRDLGWAIIDTAELSFADEIKLFMEAEAYCGAIGSGFSNAVWSRPGCAVIQLASEQIIDASTEWICVRNNLRWRYLICPHDAQQRVYADLAEVKKVLRDLSLV